MLAIVCVFLLSIEFKYQTNVFFSHERVNLLLSQDSITKHEHILYKDADLAVTAQLSDILDAQSWTKVRKVKDQDAEPILVIEHADFMLIYIYGTYARLVDGWYLAMPDAYYTFPSDISEELITYLETCESR